MLSLKKLKNHIMADTISKVKCEENTFVFRKGFFYRHGETAQNFANCILSQISNLGYIGIILNVNEFWKPFKGGASIRNQSHFMAKIKITR